MASNGRTFRVFVSSTFDDLIAERNALQADTFPRLRELCRQHASSFQAIDLRWGVSEEAGLDQQAMPICLRELRRCQAITPRPNFIVLLGQRYGWLPVPATIPADEFEAIKAATSEANDRELLARWFRRDGNAVPAEYVLSRRSGEFVDSKRWAEEEAALRRVLLSALPKLQPEARLKYERSATEQEICDGALAAEVDHAFVYRRIIEGLPETANVYRDADPEARTQLTALVAALGGDPARTYHPSWTADGPDGTHLAQLCQDVYDDLSKAIQEQLADLQAIDPLTAEVQAHDGFGRERAADFLGREDALDVVAGYLNGDQKQPLVVHGVSGSGKSALLARAFALAAKAHPNAVRISRFIGATPTSSDIRSLLHSLGQQLATAYGADPAEVPADYQELVKEFSERLTQATAERPMILFLDALDQLSPLNHPSYLAWLPVELPPHVRLVISVLERDDAGGASFRTAQARWPAEAMLLVRPFAPDEAAELLDQWLRDAGRQLTAEQRDDILRRFDGTPLYLKVAFEEARRWREWDGRADDEPGLADTTEGVLEDLLSRLEQPAEHGDVLVRKTLGYLGAARHGLSEDELLDVLAEDQEVWFWLDQTKHHDLPERRLPVALWTRLYNDLEPYLTEREADGARLLGFYHRQVGEVAAKRYLDGARAAEAHQGLARYFERQPYWSDSHGRQPDAPTDGVLSPGTWDGSGKPRAVRVANARKVYELPWHLLHSEQWSRLDHLLGSFAFLAAKCVSQDGGTSGIHGLLEDFQGASSAWPAEGFPLLVVGSALYQAAPLLSQSPTSLYQELHNAGVFPLLTDVPAPEYPWFDRLDGLSSDRVRLSGHSPGHVACRFEPAGHRLWTAGTDHALRCWDTSTLSEAQPPWVIERPIWEVAHHPSQPWIALIVGTLDRLQVRVIDTRTYQTLWEHPPLERTTEVSIHHWSPKPQTSFQHADRPAAPSDGQETSRYGGEFHGAVAFAADGRVLHASLGSSVLLRISVGDWGMTEERDEDRGPISCLAAGDPLCAGYLASGPLRVIGDLGDGRVLGVREESVTACAVLDDGRHLFAGVTGMIWIVDTETGLRELVQAGEGSAIVACVPRTGQSCLLAREDGTLLALDLASHELRVEAAFGVPLTGMDCAVGSGMVAVGLLDGNVELMPTAANHWSSDSDARLAALSPDGETMAIVTPSEVRIGQPARMRLEHEDGPVTACRFPGVDTVVTGTSGGTVRIWNAVTGAVTEHLAVRGPVSWIDASDNLTRVAVISGLGALDIWEPGNGPPTRLFHQQVRRAWLSSSGRWLAVAGRDHGFMLLESCGSDWHQTVVLLPAAVECAAFDSAETRLAAAGRDGRLFESALGPDREPVELAKGPVCPKGMAYVGTDLLVVGETVVAYSNDSVAGQLRLPGLQSVDFVPDTCVLLAKCIGMPAVRYGWRTLDRGRQHE